MKIWDAIKKPFGKTSKDSMEKAPFDGGYQGDGNSILTRILSTGSAPRRGSRELLEAYKCLPWLRAVVDRISVSTSSVPWHLYREENGKQRIGNIPTTKSRSMVEVENPFNVLMSRPNPVMTGLALRQTAQIYLELLGESFIIIERNAQGQPAELWPIPPTWVNATPSGDTPSFNISYNSLQMDVAESDMLWMSYPDPMNPYARGTGIGQTLGDELDTDEYTAKHVKSWFYNRATPELLVGVKGASENQLRGAKQAWEDAHRGAFRAFNSHWHSGELDVKQLSQTFADQQLIELRRYERDIIIHTFGIPSELLGITENSNRATIESADYLYSRWTITPRLEFWRTELQEKLVPSFGQGLFLEYDNPVPEDKEFQMNLIKVAPYAFTINEVRDVAGLGPREDGDRYPVDGTTTFVSVDDDDVGPAMPDIEAENIEAEEEIENYEERSIRKAVTESNIETILDALQPETLDLYTKKEIEDAVGEMGNLTLVSAGLEPSFSMLSPQVIEYLQGYSSVDIVGINDVTRNEVKDRLTAGVIRGEDVDRLSYRIKGLYDEYYKNRSKTIARTEVMRSSNFARLQGLSQPGVFEGKRWLTARDARVRFRGSMSGHRQLHGKVVKMEEPFRIGTATAMYPSDFGVAALDINCRCTIVPVVSITKSKTVKETEREEEIDAEWVEEADEVVFSNEELVYAKEFDDFTDVKFEVLRKAFIKAFEVQEEMLLEALRSYG